MSPVRLFSGGQEWSRTTGAPNRATGLQPVPAPYRSTYPWMRWWGSNPRHPSPKPGALPLSYTSFGVTDGT